MSRIIALILFLTATTAQAATTHKRVELENQIRERVSMITDKVDPLAIIQVHVILKKLSTQTPAFGYDLEVTPLDTDGELGPASIESVSVRIVTQVESLPEWMRKEVDKAVGLDGVKMNISYEKAAGAIANQREEFAKIAREAALAAVKGLDHMKYGIWGIFGGLLLTLSTIALGIFGASKKLTTALTKVIEEKIVPAMEASKPTQAQMFEKSGGGGGGQDKSVAVMAGGAGGTGPGGAKEMADMPHDALMALLADCYWTESDGYANFVWNQMTQEQREKVIASKQIDPAYFSYVRQVAPQNLGYHTDARYLFAAKEFAEADQNEVAQWVKTNPKQFARVTPLRWDLLPLSLEARIKFNDTPATEIDTTSPVKLVGMSKPRVLKSQLQIKTLKAEDEDYIWANPTKIPTEVRGSLRTLAWLAMAPADYRERILADIDARQLAEAWSGPESVLAKLTEVLPAKKQDMLKHFLTSVTPSRDSSAFAYLFEAGLQSPIDSNDIKEAA